MRKQPLHYASTSRKRFPAALLALVFGVVLLLMWFAEEATTYAPSPRNAVHQWLSANIYLFGAGVSLGLAAGLRFVRTK